MILYLSVRDLGFGRQVEFLGYQPAKRAVPVPKIVKVIARGKPDDNVGVFASLARNNGCLTVIQDVLIF